MLLQYGIIFVASLGMLLAILEQYTLVLFQNSDLNGVSVSETIQEVIKDVKVIPYSYNNQTTEICSGQLIIS